MSIVLLISGLTACDNDNEIDNSDFEAKEEALAPAVAQYVNNTVIATYHSLADASIELYEVISALKSNKTQANLDAAATAWKQSRVYWERSEAFLFGAVADFGIDPRIDTWPLSIINVNQIISSGGMITDETDEGSVGFHGIEYILFKEGATKNLNEITESQLTYALSVAGDLRKRCIQLEAAWAGLENVSDFKKSIIAEFGLQTKPTSSSLNYGEHLLKAGETGSFYKTVTDAAIAILTGCSDISAEVGEMKIGNAYRGDDYNYIESPYSYNSKTDFVDNMRSIANAYLGGADETNRGASVSDYIKSVDADLDAKIRAAIENCIAKINAIPTPFAKNYSSAEAGEAMDACDDLTRVLDSAREKLRE